MPVIFFDFCHSNSSTEETTWKTVTMTAICSNWTGRQWTQMHVAHSRDKARAVVYTIMDRGKFPDKLRNISLQEGTCFLQ